MAASAKRGNSGKVVIDGGDEYGACLAAERGTEDLVSNPKMTPTMDGMRQEGEH
jgi:hypothetical protein